LCLASNAKKPFREEAAYPIVEREVRDFARLEHFQKYPIRIASIFPVTISIEWNEADVVSVEDHGTADPTGINTVMRPFPAMSYNIVSCLSSLLISDHSCFAIPAQQSKYGSTSAANWEMSPGQGVLPTLRKPLEIARSIQRRTMSFLGHSVQPWSGLSSRDP